MGHASVTDQPGGGEPGPQPPGAEGWPEGSGAAGAAQRPGADGWPTAAYPVVNGPVGPGPGSVGLGSAGLGSVGLGSVGLGSVGPGREVPERVVDAEPGPPQWRRPGFGMVMVAVPVFVAVTLGVVTVLSNDPDSGDRSPRTAAPADRGVAPRFVDPANSREVSAPLQGRDEASFDLITDTTAVRLTVSDLGDRLYRISTPSRANVLPRPEVDRDRVLLHLVPSGENGPGAVDIELNSRVRWQLRLTGGAAEQVLDLGEARLAGVELLGGATRVELTLPPPEGTLTVRMTGGANQFLVTAPPGPPARVRLANGAAAVTLDGDRRSGIARGTVFTTEGWAGADDRFDIDLVAGVATFTVRRR